MHAFDQDGQRPKHAPAIGAAGDVGLDAAALPAPQLPVEVGRQAALDGAMAYQGPIIRSAIIMAAAIRTIGGSQKITTPNTHQNATPAP